MNEKAKTVELLQKLFPFYEAPRVRNNLEGIFNLIDSHSVLEQEEFEDLLFVCLQGTLQQNVVEVLNTTFPHVFEETDAQHLLAAKKAGTLSNFIREKRGSLLDLISHSIPLLLEELMTTYAVHVREQQKHKVRCFSTQSLNHEEAVKVLLQFGLAANFHTIRLLDGDFLYENKCYTEESALSLVSEAFAEALEYSKSLIMLDLDSLVEVSRSYSSIKKELTAAVINGDDNSFTYQVARPRLLDMLLSKMDSAATTTCRACWVCAFSNHHYLSLILKERLNWPDTPNLERKLAQEENRRKLVCIRCRAKYTEPENNHSACGKHWGSIFLQTDVVRTEEGHERPPQPNLFLTFEQAQRLIDRGEALGMDVRWTCCSQQGLYGRGCVPRKHKRPFNH